MRGSILVDGTGNANSYCTHIQENLKSPRYNCAYKLIKNKIWIVQTAVNFANEELSIQYSPDGSYWWVDRANDYPLELYTLTCQRYFLPVPVPVIQHPPLQTYPLVLPPKADHADELIAAPYYFHYPACVPSCSLRLATLNVNGALHSSDPITINSIGRLMDAAEISIMGITDARLALP
jgi:hypothetical protein